MHIGYRVFREIRRLLLVLLIAGCAPSAFGDAIVKVQAMTASTIAEYFIEEEGIRVELEIGFVDLPAFSNLMPDPIYERLGHDPKPLTERLPIFFGENFIVIPDGGDPIMGGIVSMEARDRIKRDEITGEPLPVSEEEAEPVVFAELFFPFKSRPSNLAIGQTSRSARAGIGFVVYHQGLPVNDFRYLGDTYVLDLDWDDPWYSSFRSRSLRRNYYAAMNGFIYVEPYEVRKEIIVRPRDLQEWIDLGLEGRSTIPVEIQTDLTLAVAEFLRQHHSVTIDGQEIVPDLARINFLRRTLRNSTVVDPPEELDLNSATLGVIFVYPTEGLPDNVTMNWDTFNDRIQVVPVASVDQAGPLPSIVTPDDPVLVWQNFLKNPILPTLVVTESPPSLFARAALWLRWVLVLAMVGAGAWVVVGVRNGKTLKASRIVALVAVLFLMAGAFWVGHEAQLTEERAGQLVSGLLHNVYRAFDFRGEEKIYDVLANSVEGDLLTQIYLETRRGLEIQNQGGARAKVKELELIELKTESGRNGGFVASVTWNVAGSVGHWGHVHRRTNQYKARLDIEPVAGVWKLTGLELLEEERL
jgi:hypothetical protein